MSMSAAYDAMTERRDERNAACRREDALESMLLECLEYFENRSDVVDGDYGVPEPNREMKMATEIKEVLGPQSSSERRADSALTASQVPA